MNSLSTPPERSRGIRWVLLGLLAVAVAQSVLLWLTRPEAPPMPVDGIEVTLTDANFQPEVLEHHGYVLVDFWFEGCPPCHRMEPVVAHLSLNYREQIKVGKLDVDRFVDTPQRYQLNAFPTLLLFRDGEVVARWDGYGGLKEMSRWLDTHIAAPAMAAADHS